MRAITVLVVEDEDTSRLYLTKTLQKLSCKVVEAKNGLDAMLVLQEQSPDLVFLDVVMPVMDGGEVLEAIRSDYRTRHLPVVITTALGDRSYVLKLAHLGITDYLIKPIHGEKVRRRITEIIAKIQRQPAQHKSAQVSAEGQETRQTILVVDPDPNFQMFFSSIYDGRYALLKSATGAEALQIYLKHFPEIVVLGQGLTVINENLLAGKIRSIPRQNDVRIILCAERPEDVTGPFDGIIRKRFLPEKFMQEFSVTALGERNSETLLAEFASEGGDRELRTAIEQTIGVMALQGVEFLKSELRPVARAGGPARPAGGRAIVRLVNKELEEGLLIEMWASEQDIRSLAEKILGGGIDAGAGAGDAFLEMCNTIAGRIRVSAANRRVRLEQGEASMQMGADSPAADSTGLFLQFVTDEGQYCALRISAERS